MVNFIRDNKILIVDDFEQHLELLRFLLERAGYRTIFEAVNGEQAVAVARENCPELIIMDINMPVMSGLEALKILRKESATSNIPVIAITGSALESDRDTLLKLGFDGFIPKPINIGSFIERIEEFIPVARHAGLAFTPDGTINFEKAQPDSYSLAPKI